MTDWREDAIAAEEFDDGFGYKIKYDEGYEYDTRSFQIFATEGSKRYIPVDVVLNPSDPDDVESKLEDAAYKLPLYMHAHSGVSISVNEFSDPWDSNQCGYAVLTKEDVKTFGFLEENYDRILRLEVENYDAYLRGSVVYWAVTKKEKCAACNHTRTEVIDSCGGYTITNFSKINDLIKEEVLPTIEYHRNAMKEAEHAATATAVGND